MFICIHVCVVILLYNPVIIALTNTYKHFYIFHSMFPAKKKKINIDNRILRKKLIRKLFLKEFVKRRL